MLKRVQCDLSRTAIPVVAHLISQIVVKKSKGPGLNSSKNGLQVMG